MKIAPMFSSVAQKVATRKKQNFAAKASQM